MKKRIVNLEMKVEMEVDLSKSTHDRRKPYEFFKICQGSGKPKKKTDYAALCYSYCASLTISTCALIVNMLAKIFINAIAFLEWNR